MKRLFALLLILSAATSAKTQMLTDTAAIRAYVQANIVTNGSRQITATMLKAIIEGQLNILPVLLNKKVDSAAVRNDTLFFFKNGVVSFSKKLPAIPSSLQATTDAGKVSTNKIDVNGIVSRDSVLSIGNVIIAAPRWTASDSVNLWPKGIGVNQGNAYDGHYRYVDSNSAIYKLDANYNKILANNNVFAGIAGTHNHIGDIDYNPNDGHLYVPMENLVSSVYTNMGIAVFDTGTLALIRFMPTSTIHNVEKTALTIYDTSLATMDFFVSQKIYIHAPYDATLLDSVQLSQSIPGTQGFVFDPATRLWYFISEQKLWSANEDGTGVLELTTLPNTQINEGHVGEGLAIVNGRLEGLVASRADALSKLYTFVPSPVNPFYVQRGSIDQNGNSTLKKMTSESTVISSLSAVKSTMKTPASIVSGYLSHDAVSTVFSRNAYFNGTRWMRDSAGVPSFYFGYHQNKQAAYLLASNPGTSLKVSLDTIFKATPGGTIIFKASVGSIGPGDIVAPVKIEPPQINNTPGYANVERTALNIQHNETASMIRMQNTGPNGTKAFIHATNDNNAALGKKVLINFADNTTTPVFTLDSATQSLRIRNHIGVGTALNANPSGLGTVSLSVSDKTAGGRAQLDLIGNRTSADQAATQFGFWNNTVRFATISALRGTTDSSGYLAFATKDTSAQPVIRMTIAEKGNVGIGTTTPTALLDLAANTASGSQLRFRDGVAPTTLRKGDTWWDGTALNFYDGSTTKNLLASSDGTWGSITGTLSNQTDLQTALNAKLNITDTAGMLTNYKHWTQGYLTNITGKVTAGTNVTRTGSGTTADPYVISASANLDSIYRYGTAGSKGFLPINFQSPTTILTPSGSQGHVIGLGMDVAFDTKRNLWVMLYANWDGTGTNTATGGHDIWGATSPDLVTWTKVGTTPIISRGTSGSTDFGGLTFPQLYYEESTSTWHCYMIAFPTVGFEVGPSVIVHATATDLLGSWTKTGTVLSAPSGWLQSGHYIFRPNVVKNGSTYYMFFNGGAYGNERFAYATSTSLSGPFVATSTPLIPAGTKAAPWCTDDFFSDPHVFFFQGKWYCFFWSNSAPSSPKIGVLWTSVEDFPSGWRAYDNYISLGAGNQQRPTVVVKDGDLYLFHNDGTLSAMNIKVATTKTDLSLDGTGQLGINTLTPSAKLHVAGDNGSTTSKSLAVFGDDLSAVTDVNRVKLTLGNTDGYSEILVGQSATRALLFNWAYNATASSAFGSLETYGNSNDLRIQSSSSGGGNTLLNVLGGGVVIGGTTRNTSAALQVANTTKGFLPPVLTTTQRGAVSTPATGLSIYNSTLGQNNTYNGAAWTGDVVVSAAATLSLLHGGDYIFTGTTTTWTLPAISATTVGRQNGIYIKNRGSGAITLNSNTGSTIYSTAAVGTLTINAGEGYLLLPDGTYFSVMGKY